MGKKAIIIGGGVAGLSAGIYGQLNGYDTRIFEMHTAPGGQCTSWTRNGYTFDYCIHWLVGTSHGPFHKIWKETGALDDSTRVVDMETYAVIRTAKGDDLIIYTDIDRWEQYLLKLAPEDGKPIRRLCRDMRTSATITLMEKSPARRTWLDSVLFFLKSARAIGVIVKHGRTDVKTYFDRLGFQSKILRDRLLGLTDAMDDFSAVAFLLTLAWFAQRNAGYPVGGSMPFTMRMADRYKALGGTFTGGTRVEKIITQGGKAIGVSFADGSVQYADFIIGAGDLHGLIYELLDGKYVTPEIEKAFREWPVFNPIVQVSFGINRPIHSDNHIYRVMATGEKIGMTILDAGYSVYNYNHDPVITPVGKCIMKLCFETPYALWEGMEKEAYRDEKSKIREDATACLEKLYPAVKGYIDAVDVATPLTGVRYTGVWKGAYEGFLPASSNIGKNLKLTIEGLDNFYIAGQWTYPGGGLPPAAQSGKWIFETICKKDKKKFRVC
jgi:phytoene desaturase